MSGYGLRRFIRRTGASIWPREARRPSWRTLALASVLLLYADTSQACFRVDPAAIATMPALSVLDAMAQDRGPSVVHASVSRRTAAPSRSVYQPPSEPDRLSRDMWLESASVDRGPAPDAVPVHAAIPALVSAATAPSATVTAVTRARPILQGQFAVLLVEMLRLRPPRGGWSPDSATGLLSTLRLRPGQPAGLLPTGGWRVQQPLTEDGLVAILRAMGIQAVSHNPAREITPAEAEALLARIASLFRPLSPAAYTEGVAPASLNLGNPRPVSPITP